MHKTRKVCESKKVGSILRTETASMEGSDVNPRGESCSNLVIDSSRNSMRNKNTSVPLRSSSDKRL
jgi:hypothetical protein